MAGRFELKKSTNDKFYFTLLAANGEVILTSEMNDTKADALAVIELVKSLGGDDGRYERLVAKDDSPYFLLKTPEGRVLGQSQMYSGSSARETGVQSCLTNAPGAEVDDRTSE